jgi:hypothetical protein
VKEARQKKSHNICSHLYEIYENDKPTDTEYMLMMARDWGVEGNEEKLLKRYFA